MGLKKHFLIGLVCGLSIVGCASSFGYKYYGLDLPDYEGTLLGPEAKNDKPFAACAPNAKEKHPCAVMFATDFFKMKEELLRLRMELKRCQQGISLEVME